MHTFLKGIRDMLNTISVVQDLNSDQGFLHLDILVPIYIYIYIYMYVCMYVCMYFSS